MRQVNAAVAINLVNYAIGPIAVISTVTACGGQGAGVSQDDRETISGEAGNQRQT
jgi:hypothetical protein